VNNPIQANASDSDKPATTLRDQYLTVHEVAAALKVHHTTIYRMLKKREIPAFRVGSDWRFSKHAIEQWIAAKQRGDKVT
jgi:excisionase family DNA binding protein